MFVKIGDPQPITSIVVPCDIDNDSTKKALKQTIKVVKDAEEAAKETIVKQEKVVK